MQTNLVDVDFMSHPIITKTKSALANKDRFDILCGDTKTLAFSADMIVFYKTQIARTNEVRDQAIVMAMELQFTALNRVSELLPTAADYYARAVDIRFGFDLSGDGTISNHTLFRAVVDPEHRHSALHDIPDPRIQDGSATPGRNAVFRSHG